MSTSLAAAQWWAFAALTVALTALWAPCVTTRQGASRWWILPAALAVVLAAAGGLMDVRATVLTLGAVLVCHRARHAAGRVSGLFRGVMQEAIHGRLPARPPAALSAAVLAGLAFGLAHMAGGVAYVLLACVAGIGYGWIYARTGSLAAAALAHTGVNLVHLLGFSYPALRSTGLE